MQDKNVNDPSPEPRELDKQSAVVEAAIAFVLDQWGEMQELEGTESMSAPVEYMELHHAVCEYKGWKPFGDFPMAEEPCDPKA